MFCGIGFNDIFRVFVAGACIGVVALFMLQRLLKKH